MEENSSHRAAIVMMIASMFVFTLSDTLAKWFVEKYPIWEIVGIRAVAALIVLGVILFRQRGSLKVSIREKPVIQLLRLAFVLSEIWCFFWSVQFLPLADVFMFYAASPLFLTAFSAVILREHVGIQRWSAVILGLVGVIFVFPPSEAAVTLPALVAVMGSMSLAMMLILTRMLRKSSGMDLLVLQTLIIGVVGVASFSVEWVTPTPLDFGMIGLMGILATGAHFLMNQSVSTAPSSVVAPFQYTSIVWAFIAGYLIWGDIPTQRALIGVAIIVGAGLFVLYREWRLGVKRKRIARTTV